MKSFVLLLALILTVCASPISKIEADQDIINDLELFTNCVDKEKFQQEVEYAAKNDPAIQHIVQYIQSNDFKDHIRNLDKDPTYLAILTDLEKQGVPAYETVNAVLEAFGIEPIVHLSVSEIQESHQVRSFDTLFDQLIATTINETCTNEVFEHNKERDPKFKALVDHLHSDEYNQLVEAFKASKTLKQTLDALNKEGLNLNKYVELLKKVYHYDW